MSVLAVRSWGNLLLLVLSSVLLAGCVQQKASMESQLRAIARNFVTELEIDVVEEEHFFGIRNDNPSSSVASYYVISEAPEAVREKLKAFHDAHEFWLAPRNDGWSRDVKLQIIDRGRPLSPAEVEEDLEFAYRHTERLKDDFAINFFVICPWYYVGDETYAIVHSDTVFLTEEGTLVVRLNLRAQARCHEV